MSRPKIVLHCITRIYKRRDFIAVGNDDRRVGKIIPTAQETTSCGMAENQDSLIFEHLQLLIIKIIAAGLGMIDITSGFFREIFLFLISLR